MINRKEEIKRKGFRMNLVEDDAMIRNANGFPSLDFGVAKVGTKTIKDATLDLGNYSRIESRLTQKEAILRALHENNYAEMREISKFFFETSGIYSRLCVYMAYMYTYD